MTELALFGTDLFGEVVRPKASGPVAERFTLPPFTLLADLAQVDIGEFCELIVQREVVRRVHEATLISERTARLGITGSGREFPGVGGK